MCVVQPMIMEELEDCTIEFLQAGLPGAFGSTDSTHIVLELCAFKLRQLHLGHKVSHISITHNLTCNHRMRILSSTKGYTARFNDKTLVQFDDFVWD